MKILLICLVLGVSLFQGCTKPKICVPEIKVQKQIVYLKQEIPDLDPAPKALDYNVSYINYNGTTYYQIRLEDGEILKLNWKRYKAWAQSNYNILKKLKDNK